MESSRNNNPFLLNHHQFASSANDSRAAQRNILDWNTAAAVAERGPHPPPLYGGGGDGRGGSGSNSHNPDPHLMCLKLGKRHYFGDGGERGKKPYYEVASPYAGVTVAAPAPVMCQVDGCQAALVNAKEYHRRHKVCEMHSKAPRVVVLGHEQRFCQQCSRFHAIGEFDEAKRSCRRRLAGHNERRRKSSHDQSTPRNQPHPVNRKLMAYGGRHPEFAQNSNGCALSLLSSKNESPSWISSPDLPAMCSAALRELIAENRAAILAQQLNLPPLPPPLHHQPQPQNGPSSVTQYQQHMGATGRTLELMQAPTSAFGLLSVGGKVKGDDDDEECRDLWGNSSRGAV